MHIKGLSKAFKNPTHSKLYKKLDVFGLHRKLDKARRRLGLTRGRLLGSLSGSTGSSINSAGAVVPSHAGSSRSITEMY